MLKVFGFVRRHDRLTHDEYRAAHAGYHNSYGRRLPGIRGYLLNVRANRDLGEALGEHGAQLNAGDPPGFDAARDGYGQLMFNSLADYLAAKSPARDKPGPRGLEWDATVAAVGGDARYLYSGPPVQFHVVEQVVVPVRRPEHCPAYAALARHSPGLLGMIVNFPSDLDVISGFFAEESGAFSAAAVANRQHFMSLFDGMGEYWFRDPAACRCWRERGGDALAALEEQLFAGMFAREVDETVAVLPDRLPAAPYYHR